MPLNELRASVVAGRAAAGIADRHGDAQKVRDRIVVARYGDEAPDAEHGGISHGADRITRVPTAWPVRTSASRCAVRICASGRRGSCRSPRSAPHTATPARCRSSSPSSPRKSPRTPSRGTSARNSGTSNRPAPRKSAAQVLPDNFAFSGRPTASVRTQVLFGAVLLPAADEVFLREYRYRDIVFEPESPNLLAKSAG